MEKHIAQDCQSVDEAAKQEMSQLLMTKRLQVTYSCLLHCSVHVTLLLLSHFCPCTPSRLLNRDTCCSKQSRLYGLCQAPFMPPVLIYASISFAEGNSDSGWGKTCKLMSGETAAESGEEGSQAPGRSRSGSCAPSPGQR